MADLIRDCMLQEPLRRPSSLSILQLSAASVREDVKIPLSELHANLDSGVGGYLIQSLMQTSKYLDEAIPFGSELTRKHRRSILDRLGLLYYVDGASQNLCQHASSLDGLLHVLTLLSEEHMLLRLIDSMDCNERWTVSGWTPLHLAAQEGNIPIVRLLLAHGAKTNLEDSDQRVARDYAQNTELRNLIGLVGNRERYNVSRDKPKTGSSEIK